MTEVSVFGRRFCQPVVFVVFSDMCSRGVLHTVDSDDVLPRIRTPDPFIDYEGIRRDIIWQCVVIWIVELWFVTVRGDTVKLCVEMSVIMRDCSFSARRNGEMCFGIGVTWGVQGQGNAPLSPKYFFLLNSFFFWLPILKETNKNRNILKTIVWVV